MVKPIMIQGTASGVGKTILTMALCRIFQQDGYLVTPFKSQNITMNTAITKEGDEIAVSQILQAYAAGTMPNADMNPVVLKPLPDYQGTQVILKGKYYDTIHADNFGEIKKTLMHEILNSYSRLSEHYDLIVIEGAGSPVELNLDKDDIVNMGVAKQVNAPVLLVSNIDRGGVFASMFGTVNLLDDAAKGYVKGLIVNRFSGDISRFRDGVAILEKITGLPVAGVVPNIILDLPEEDSLYGVEGAPFQLGSNYDSQFDLIADTVRQSLDMDLIYGILSGGGGGKHE